MLHTIAVPYLSLLTQGEPGAPGIPGIVGKPGDQGRDGRKGRPGLSGYPVSCAGDYHVDNYNECVCVYVCVCVLLIVPGSSWRRW